MRLEMGMSTKLQMQQKLVLAPQIIQSIEILQFPSMNLLDYVEQQLNDNEALELEIPEDPPAPTTEAGVNGTETAEKTETGDKEIDFVAEEWEEFKPRRAIAGERDGKLEALQNTAGRPDSLQDLLAEQLRFQEVSPRILELARILTYNLDDQGFLTPHRFVSEVLAATDDQGYLLKPLSEIVAAVDGVAAVKVPAAKRGVTPDQIATAEMARDRHLLELQRVLTVVQHIRAAPGGAALGDRDLLMCYPLVDVLEQTDGDYTLEEAEEALRLLQTLEPKGVACRTLEETLLVQLAPDDLLYREKYEIIAHHLEDLQKNRLQRIAREMSLEIADLSLIIEEFKELDPTPAARLAPSVVEAVHPDVVIEETDGEYRIRLVSGYLPPLRVSSDFVKLANDKDASGDMRELARRKVEGARWLIDAIQQRQATLTRVAERIFHHQRDFLFHGPDALRPLKMQTVADALSIHVSTVSRAIADKWVQTPRGIFPLKFFFTGGTETASGRVEARHSVKNRVKAIIEAEDATRPLSDDDVASKLREQGLEIARRTVTKYRKQLGVPSSRQRRRWS